MPPADALAQPATAFRAADWAVLAGYTALLVVTGWLFARREQKTTGEYFLAGRRMPVWAVAVSIIATSLSAATFVGAPEQAYAGDLTYLSTNLGGVVAVLVVATFFVPAFYRHGCTTIYELLEHRFGGEAKRAASAAFMLGRLMASGARIYIAAIPLCMILFGAGVAERPDYPLKMALAIGALALVGTLYTLSGGISSVIWTDVIQTGVLLVAVLGAIVVLYHKIDLPVESLVYELSGRRTGGPDKLRVFALGLDPSKPGWGFDPSARFTVLTALLGFSLLNIAAYGTDHDMVQRTLTCRSAVQGSRSVWLSMAVGIPMVTLFMVVGLLLHVFYAGPATAGAGASAGPPPESKHVFIRFILTEMPPGLAGLMLAGLFAAGVGSLTSAINALAATTIKDFYQPLAPGRQERHYLAASRWAVVGWGAALAVFAVLCLAWQRAAPKTTLIDLALSVMTFAYAGLLGVFLTALFTRRGSARSVIAGLVTGFAVIALLQGPVWRAWTPWVPGVGEALSKVELSLAWPMLAATALATGVCCLGRREGAP